MSDPMLGTSKERADYQAKLIQIAREENEKMRQERRAPITPQDEEPVIFGTTGFGNGVTKTVNG